MTFTLLVADYAKWHYTTALQSGFHLWLNFVIYTAHLFMIKLHARTLFAPWHRMTESRSKKWNWEDWATTAVVNSVSRILGFFLRSIIILAGLCFIGILCVSVFIGYIVWILAPLVVSSSIVSGIALICIYLYAFI